MGDKQSSITDRQLLADFISASLRNQADRDYISARALYRAELFHNFLWPSLQAVEKYLKGILLFSYRSVKNYDHKLEQLLAATKDLPSLDFSVPPEVEEFITRLTWNAGDRYLVRQFFLNGDELAKLDQTVWHLRRYCQDFLLMPFDENLWDAGYVAMSKRDLERAKCADPMHPTRFRISGDGYLERAMERGPVKTRAALVWHNRYYYQKRRPLIRQGHPRFENPAHVRHPRLRQVLDGLIKIPKGI